MGVNTDAKKAPFMGAILVCELYKIDCQVVYWIWTVRTLVVCSLSKVIVRTPSLSSALTEPSSSLTGTGNAMVRENSPQ